MSEIIKKLYNGEISIADETITDNKEYDEARQEVYDLYEKIRKDLSDDKKKLFTKYTDLMYSMESITNEDYFIKGFKMGARLTQEIYN